MVFLELAAQAVRGFSPSIKVALKPGYLVLRSPSAVAPLGGLFAALAYPDGRGGDAVYLAPGEKKGRAGFTLAGADQSTWRIVRDLGGSGSLHKLNKATGQFDLVTEDSAEMVQTLRSAAGLPPRSTWEQLFGFTPGQFPSKRPKGGNTPAKGKSRVSNPSLEPVAPPLDPEALKAKLPALEEEMRLSKIVGDLQFRQDTLQNEIFKFDTRLKLYEDTRVALENARAAAAKAPTPESLNLQKDILARVQKFPSDVQRKDEALARLATEKEAAEAEQQSRDVYVQPLQTDPRFLAPLAVGVLAIIGGFVFDGGAQYVALLGLPAFSFAALIALRFIEELQSKSRKSNKGDMYAAREKKVLDEFAAAEAPIKAACAAAGVETVDEFLSIMSQRPGLDERAAQLQVQFAEMSADPETDQALRQATALKAEQEKVNEKLLSMAGGYIRSPGEVERELGQVRDQLAKLEAPAAPPPKAEEFVAIEEKQEPLEDPVPALMAMGADLFRADVPTLWALLKDRCIQYLVALTDKRYHLLEVDKDGNAKVHAPGRVIGIGELPHRDVDLIYLSLRLTLVEKYAARDKIPVIVEDGFSSQLEPAKQALLARMLKHLGTSTQVLHVTPTGHNAGATDMVLAL